MENLRVVIEREGKLLAQDRHSERDECWWAAPDDPFVLLFDVGMESIEQTAALAQRYGGDETICEVDEGGRLHALERRTWSAHTCSPSEAVMPEQMRAAAKDLERGPDWCPCCGQGLDVRERLAAYAHEAWAGWMRHLADKHAMYSATRGDADRWARQMRTPYVELSEEEKTSDRAQADRILAILRGEE